MASVRRDFGSGLLNIVLCGKIQKMFDRFAPTALIAADKFADEAGLSRADLDKALRANRIFAIELSGKSYVPAFFLDTRYERRHLHSICRVLGNLTGGSKLQFFTTPKGSLSGRTPLDALADRSVAAVRCTAHGFVER